MSTDWMDRLREVGELNDEWSATELAMAPAPLYTIDAPDRPASHRYRTPASAAAAVILVALVAIGLAVSGGDESTPPAEPAEVPPPPETSPPVEDTTDRETEEATGDPTNSEFCRLAYPSLSEEVDGTYVGSPEHVAWFDSLLAVAPEEIVDDLRAVRDYFDEYVDPAIPDSNLIWNFPPEIQEQSTRVQAEIARLCQQPEPTD